MPSDRRVRVAAVNDYELVVRGLASLLGQHYDRLEVVDAIVIGEPIDGPVEVALFDTYGRLGVGTSALHALADMPDVEKVALFTLELAPDVVAQARRAGAVGFISKALDGAAIADAVVRIAAGEEVMAGSAETSEASPELVWPGKDLGLTEQQSQILALVAQGHSNREIGEAMYLSAETVKTYLRPIYKLLGVRNRTEAAAFAHGAQAFRRHPG